MKCLGRDHGDGEVIILNASRHIGRSLLDQEHDRLSCERCRRARSLSTMEERKEENKWKDEVFMIRGQSWFCNQGQEDRKTARGKFWKMLKRRWMVRKQNNMVVGFCFHRGHDRSLKSWVGFILPSTPSSSLCRLCRADFLLCCHKYDRRGILQASWSRVWVILSLHSFSIIELLHPTVRWRCTIRFIWTSAHPESKGLILTDLNELATP